jgi:hypothetical protein
MHFSAFKIYVDFFARISRLDATILTGIISKVPQILNWNSSNLIVFFVFARIFKLT